MDKKQCTFKLDEDKHREIKKRAIDLGYNFSELLAILIEIELKEEIISKYQSKK